MSAFPELLVGLDLAEVDRIARILERHAQRFLDRVFRPGEVLSRRRQPSAFAQHVAGRFAAKEAAMKALGTGWRQLSFREIEIGREASGKPRIRFHGRAQERARQLGVFAAEVSITHTDSVAAAVVVLLTRAEAEAGPKGRRANGEGRT